MKSMNASKYKPYPVIDIPDRTWPNKIIEKAPAWCSVDLRDGNQALNIPMSVDKKLEMFSLLVNMGFKEIEVGFPSASETEYKFMRKLIEEKLIPEDVTVQVLTQAREHLIRRTFESLEGAKKAIIHLYNSTSTAQREVVFNKSKDEIRKIAVEGARLIKTLAQGPGSSGFRLEYSPESFTGTEPDYALDVCRAVIDAWQPTTKNRIIINLPSTVEMSTPNVFADRIEWFCRNVGRREAVTISVHTHNDRGTAVASAELAVMAGADRVEGALFGNGERSGNMDIITMALNLYSRGVDPELNISDINKIKDVYSRCTGLEVNPRHPYAGELVYTAFSGSHQDAISKGMKAYAASSGETWDVPYLPIDPGDIGRTYESIIRINSQSGKGGIAYVLETEFGYQIPKWMQPDFGRVIQKLADITGKELSTQEIFDSFRKEYMDNKGIFHLESCRVDMDKTGTSDTARVRAVLRSDNGCREFETSGNGPLDAFAKGLQEIAGKPFTVSNYSEHALSKGSDSPAAAYIAVRNEKGAEFFAAWTDTNIAVASMNALLNALNKMLNG